MIPMKAYVAMRQLSDQITNIAEIKDEEVWKAF